MIHSAVTFFCLLLLSLQLSAQQTVSLQEAFKIGLENNFAIKKQQVVIEQAELDRRINRTLYLPEVQAGGGFNYVSEVATIELPAPLSAAIGSIEAGVKEQNDFNLQLTQPLFTGFRTHHLVKVSEARTAAERMSEAAIRNNLLLQIGKLYYTIQSNLLNQQVLTTTIDRIDRRLQQAKNFYATGQAAPYDTLESANRKLQQVTRLKSLRYAEAILQKQFRDLLNTTAEIVVGAEDLTATTNNKNLPANSATSSRAEIGQLEQLKFAQQHATSALKSAYFPQVMARASWHYARPGVNFFRDEWMDYYTVGVQLRWSLWNWGRDYQQVNKAKLGIRQLELQQQQLQQRFDTEITTADRSLQAAKDLVSAQRLLVEREQERYRISEEQFRQSQISSIDLNDAENDLTNATLLLQQYLVEVRLWQLQLEHATGKLGQAAGK